MSAHNVNEAAASPGSQRSSLQIAQDCRARGDEQGEEEALQSHLEVNKRDIRGLLAMGELLARRGDERAASSFFGMALKVAASPAGYPPDLLPQLKQAQAYAQAAQERFARELQGRLQGSAFTEGNVSPRVTHAIKLLLGEVPLHLQQPNKFYFPGLAQRFFYEREEFAWAGDVEAHTDAIEEELAAVIALGDEGFSAQTRMDPRSPPPLSPLLNDPAWSAYHLWMRGTEVTDHTARVPRTVEALEAAPIPRVSGFAPMIMFSLLRPGTTIPPHFGVTNTRLICHLPILAPEGCALRVGSESRSWKRGELLIFDDTFEHEAWNRGSDTRVVLLFEIWRPDISAAERDELTALFEAVEIEDDGD